MPSGDRSIKILNISIPAPAGGNVIAEIRWEFRVEDRVGKVQVQQGGNLSIDLGTPATALAMTVAQIRTAAVAKINSDATIPEHDSAS